jgi:hypothetical protein
MKVKDLALLGIPGFLTVFLSVSAILFNAPEGYVPLHGNPFHVRSQTKLSVLFWITALVALLEVAATVIQLYPIFDQWSSLHLYLIAFVWVCLVHVVGTGNCELSVEQSTEFL